mmetsp:Transcript_128857/g.411971  ORF Transcript_128857/g.411971 Transcript_128857/m.411971 type:complete len:116 (-) Transcript_128857:94-441(-)
MACPIWVVPVTTAQGTELVPLLSPQWAMGSYDFYGFGFEDPSAATPGFDCTNFQISTGFVAAAGSEPTSPWSHYQNDGSFVGGRGGSLGAAGSTPSTLEELDEVLRTAMPDRYED